MMMLMVVVVVVVVVVVCSKTTYWSSNLFGCGDRFDLLIHTALLMAKRPLRRENAPSSSD